MQSQDSTIETISKQNNEPAWLQEKRKAALHVFKELPTPNFIYGLNINLDIKIDFDSLPTSTQSLKQTIVGHGATIQNFKEALEKNEALLKEKFMTSCVPAQNKFSTFHNAFVNNLNLIIIPKNTEIKEPIEIATILGKGTHFDHTIIIAEPNSKAIIVEHVSSEDKETAHYSKIVEIFTEDNASIDYGSLQELNENSFHFTIKRAVTGKDSTINWLDCCFGSSVTLSDVSTHLNNSGAETNNHGIFFGNEKQQFDLVTNSIHNAPNTMSDIFVKGALTGAGKCLYRGLVKIGQPASGSNGYQQQDTLLLSPDAVADSIPNLEIDNSDVKCSHGATIGKIDTEKLFYLQSRGLSSKDATREYVKGFFEPLIQKMQIENLRESMHTLVEKRMQ